MCKGDDDFFSINFVYNLFLLCIISKILTSIFFFFAFRQSLLLKEGAVHMLSQVLEICIGVTSSDSNRILESKILAKYGPSVLSWCIPVFNSIYMVCDSRIPGQYPGMYDR